MILTQDKKKVIWPAGEGVFRTQILYDQYFIDFTADVLWLRTQCNNEGN